MNQTLMFYYCSLLGYVILLIALVWHVPVGMWYSDMLWDIKLQYCLLHIITYWTTKQKYQLEQFKGKWQIFAHIYCYYLFIFIYSLIFIYLKRKFIVIWKEFLYLWPHLFWLPHKTCSIYTDIVHYSSCSETKVMVTCHRLQQWYL